MLIVMFSAAVIVVTAIFIGMNTIEKRVKQYLLVNALLFVCLAYKVAHGESGFWTTVIMIVIVAITACVVLYYSISEQEMAGAGKSATQTIEPAN